MKFRISRAAEGDIFNILRRTKKDFGSAQVVAYAGIIAAGIRLIAEKPNRSSGIDRSDIETGVRSFHLELVTRRRHSASHMLYFKEMTNAEGALELVVLRVLHDSMEPKRRLIRALREESPLSPEPPEE